MTRSMRPCSNMVTIDDVARLAGVSIATASRVVSAKHSVREANRTKVMAAVRTLNYIPNLAARSLATAARERIAIIYSQDFDSGLSAILPRALERSAAMGAELVLLGWEPDEAQSRRVLIDKIRGEAISGLMLVSSTGDETALEQTLSGQTGLPVVTLGGGLDLGFSIVGVDERAAAAQMTRRLLDLGHRHIGFITGAESSRRARARRRGFEAEMDAVPQARMVIVPGDFSFTSGLAAADRLIGSADPPTAIFAANDEMAAAVVSVAQRRGLDVPDDVTVVGFGDTPIATRVWPALTTISQPVGAIAEAAIDLLLRQVREARAGTPPAPQAEILAHDLVMRRSCAPPKGLYKHPNKQPVGLSRRASS